MLPLYVYTVLYHLFQYVYLLKNRGSGVDTANMAVLIPLTRCAVHIPNQRNLYARCALYPVYNTGCSFEVWLQWDKGICIFIFNVSYVGISCYSSTNCEEVNGAGPFIVSSQEECCLPSQFQARSYRVPLPITNGGIGLSECTQCIGKETICNHCVYYHLANTTYKNSHERIPCTNRCMKDCHLGYLHM